MSWELKRTKQCAKCPWRKDVDPNDIPNGYTRERHEALGCTIAKGLNIGGIGGEMRVMACHETEDAHCLGWLVNQLGPGNNIPLRMQMLQCDNRAEIVLSGEQWDSFEDTLPDG